MKKLFWAAALLALVVPAQTACVVRISDLRYTPVPPNPIRVAGRVTSVSPLKLNDGSGAITVAGAEAALSDFLVVTGDWDGSVLTVTGGVDFALPPAPCDMVFVPAGSFLMGNSASDPDVPTDERPQHPVNLSGYWIGKHEVTRGEYQRFIADGGYVNPSYWSSEGCAWRDGNRRVQPDFWDAPQDWGGGLFVQTDAHPVVGVTYYEAEAYCNWAGGHLPTEAQWEKAARWTGSHSSRWPWGDAWDVENCNNWNDTNPAGGGYQQFQTSPVGSYPAGASPYGLHDMAGNVYAWCQNWYVSYPGSSDPFDHTGIYRVLRGGSWNYHESEARCARRYPQSQNYDWLYNGFRFAR